MIDSEERYKDGVIDNISDIEQNVGQRDIAIKKRILGLSEIYRDCVIPHLVKQPFSFAFFDVYRRYLGEIRYQQDEIDFAIKLSHLAGALDRKNISMDDYEAYIDENPKNVIQLIRIAEQIDPRSEILPVDQITCDFARKLKKLCDPQLLAEELKNAF